MTRYSRGADFERRVKADLQAHGWASMRIAGSRGLVDIVGKAPEPDGRTVWVQCKTNGRLSEEELQALVLYCSAFSTTPLLAYKAEGNCYYTELVSMTDWWPGEVI